MKHTDISTARFEIFDDTQKAQEYVKLFNYNAVAKFDGLTAGKCTIVCNSNGDLKCQLITLRLDFSLYGRFVASM